MLDQFARAYRSAAVFSRRDFRERFTGGLDYYLQIAAGVLRHLGDVLSRVHDPAPHLGLVQLADVTRD
jgi:hypothetical protein